MAKDTESTTRPAKPLVFKSTNGIKLQGAFPGGGSGASSKLARMALENPEEVERIIDEAFAQAIEDDRRKKEDKAMGED